MKKINLLHIIKWYFITRYKGYHFNNRTKLIAWQQKKVKVLLDFVLKNSAFYKKFYSGHFNDSSSWETLPLLNKNIMMKNFSSLNTAGVNVDNAYEVAIKAEQSRNFSPTLQNLTVGLSSGTTGNRGLFLVSEKERLAWAGAMIAKMRLNLFSKQRIAFFLRANSNIYTTLNSRFVKFNFFDLLDDVEFHIDKLNQLQPTILVAPPSMLRLLADIQNKKLFIAPTKIISVAEVLEIHDREYIEKTFKQIIHQVYQATEGFLGTSCKYGTLHLNEDILLVEKEYIDIEKKKFIPIITDLFRKTQPIIRYRLNDILTERKDSCPCGSVYTALEQIDGRSDDLFYIKSLPDGKLKPLFPDYIRRALMTSSPDLIEYSVVQHDPLKIQVNLRCKEQAEEKIKKQIHENLKTLHEQLGAICPTISFANFSPPERGVKLRRIIRNFAIDEDNIHV